MSCLQYLLDNGAPATEPNIAGREPIHTAVIKNKRTAIIMLLHAGVDPNDTDGEGWSPLHWAVQTKKLNNVQMLLDFGANPNQPDYENVTPIDLAEETGNKEIIDLLMKYKDTAPNENPGMGGCNFLSFLFGKPEPNVLPTKRKRYTTN